MTVCHVIINVIGNVVGTVVSTMVCSDDVVLCVVMILSINRNAGGSHRERAQKK
jgi:hypothetical protein